MFNLLLTNLELRALVNSLVISLGVSFFSLMISLFLVISLSFYRLPGRRLFSFLFLIPLLIPPYLHAFSWMHLIMFMRDYNLLGSFSNFAIDLLSSILGIIAVLTLAYFPISLFIIQQAVRNILQQLIDAAIQVAKPAKVIKHVVITAILPAMFTAALLTFIFTFITFDVPAFLGKNVFITQIFKSFTFTGEVTRALYLSAIPVVIVGTLWAILFVFIIKEKPFISLQSISKDQTL